MTEQEYRAVDRKSYSRVTSFYKKGRRYYKRKFIDKEVEDEEMTIYMKTGSAVDCLLFDKGNFDNRFHLGTVKSESKGEATKGESFVKYLFNHQKANPDVTFVDSAREAYTLAELKVPNFETYMQKFEGSELSKLYSDLLASEGKIVISVQDDANIKKIYNELKYGITKELFSGDVLGQVPILFTYKRWDLKCLVDLIKFDHKNKIIYPLDLKVVSDVEEFQYAWLKDMYYVQEALYTKGIEAWRDEHYKGYDIMKFQFIAADNINNKQPLVFDIHPSEGDLYSGFKTQSGRFYKGLDAMLEEIEWHENNNKWTISKDNFESNGYVTRVV